ncbi:MAG: hydroxyacylglutathione hydrolase [Solirubrobacteraceae bacterium]|jgi:glyoxylase-like metal-dependent hydrolase (beta-lactamase superfamily II)|nr:hydroxyacylglutathione hydrolase [Solirubrobacteraceae bacterium]
MRQLGPGVHVLDGRPRDAFNVHLLEDVVVDAATRHGARRLLPQLRGVPVAAHALTHAHADHQGSSAALCEALGLPLWAPAGEADAVRTGAIGPLGPVNRITTWQLGHWAGPGHPVARELREGDEVAGFRVLETPGHSPGHVSYWREGDGVLIAGDVLFGRHPITGRPGLHEPPVGFTIDPVANRRAIRRLAALEPRIVGFGHGPALRDPRRLQAFAAALPPD